MEKVIQSDNDKDYIFLSQLVQARGIRLGIEAHRRSKPYNMGTFIGNSMIVGLRFHGQV